MERLTTFEDIFNKLITDFQGEMVEIFTRKEGMEIARFLIQIDEIAIKPLKQNSKIGLIVIRESSKNLYNTTVNIPFPLGFNTMSAVFLEQGVTIKSLDMEYIIKKKAGNIKRLA